MRILWSRTACLLAATSLSFPATWPARAQDASGAAPPALVGRISALTGTVSFHPAQDANAGDWRQASLNEPVSSGDALFVQNGGRAEVEFASSLIGLDQASELDVGQLDASRLAASEPQGRMFVGLSGAAPGVAPTDGVIATPRGTVTLAAPGTYEVAAGDSASPTTVTVLAGSAQVSGPVTLDVPAGSTATLTGTDRVSGVVGPSGAPDPFLAAMLSELQARQGQAGGLPRECGCAGMTGVSALAGSGTWRSSAQYGQVWYPPVEAGWVPYREGSWQYDAPWGWTWVDDEPWGFAPFHYGRWAQIDGAWGWVPGDAGPVEGGYVGPVYDGFPEPVYAPALVAWGDVGPGAAFGAVAGALVGAAIGGAIGWLPLGPGEAYVPPYGGGGRYFERINQFNVRNVRNVTTINNYYGDRHFGGFANRGAATMMAADAMRRGDPVGRNARGFTQAAFEQRPVEGRHVIGRPGAGEGFGRQASGPAIDRGAFHPASLEGGRLPFRGGGPGGGAGTPGQRLGGSEQGHAGLIAAGIAGAAGAGLAAHALAGHAGAAPGVAGPQGGGFRAGAAGERGPGGGGAMSGLPGLRQHATVEQGRPGGAPMVFRGGAPGTRSEGHDGAVVPAAGVAGLAAGGISAGRHEGGGPAADVARGRFDGAGGGLVGRGTASGAEPEHLVRPPAEAPHGVGERGGVAGQGGRPGIAQGPRPQVMPVRPQVQRPHFEAARPETPQIERPHFEAARPETPQIERPHFEAARPQGPQMQRPQFQAARPQMPMQRPAFQAARPQMQAARPQARPGPRPEERDPRQH